MTKLKLSIIFLILSIIIVTNVYSIKVKKYHRFYDIRGNSTNFDIYRHLSTKTPYWILKKGDDSNEEIINQNNVEETPIITNDKDSTLNADSSSSSSEEVCKIIHFNFLARHGSRLPVISAITKLQQLPLELNQYFDKITPQYKWIMNWTVPYPVTTAGNLILQGQYEHYNISKRFRERYPEFFNRTYQPSNYPIQSTAVSRVGISASSFSYGLFQGTGQLGSENFEPVFIQSQSLDSDNLLRFFDTCKSYRQLIDTDVINKNEQTLWDSMIFPNISLEISTKLGLQDIWEPTISSVNNIFAACAYELSISNDDKHWCSLLSQDNILNWEYSEDLSNYWMKSYGNIHNYKISSILLKDIFSTLDEFVYGNYSASSSSGSDSSSSSSGSDSGSSTNGISKPPRSILRFAHAETVIPFITLLGLYKDNFTLFANSSQEEIQNRQFRTSIISPYASNVGFFLLDCGSDGYKIKVEHNELPIQIPGCDGLFCDYQQFSKIFQEVREFNWNDYCDSPTNNSLPNDSSNSNSDDKINHENQITIKDLKVYLAVFLPISFILGSILTIAVLNFILKSKNSPYMRLSKNVQ